MHAGRDRSGSSTTEEEIYRDDYYQAVHLNIAAVLITILVSLLILTWYILSNYLFISILDKTGVMLLPVFSMLSLLLVVGCIWMWITWFRADMRRRHLFLPLTLSIVELVYGMMAFYIISAILYQVLWGLST